MKIYKHNSQILSIVYKDKDWIKGLNFITPNELYIQVGSWWYDKGKKLDSHIHKDHMRKTLKTQEMIYKCEIDDNVHIHVLTNKLN